MDRRARLEWLRDLLIESLDASDVANRAALAKQLRDTLGEIEAINEALPSGDEVDEFTSKLAAKRKAAAASGATKGRKPRARSS